MPPPPKKAMSELLGDERVREELRKVADPSASYAGPVFLHGQPLAGNSSRFPVAMGLIDPAARIVSIQPTDQAASWASQRAQQWAPNDTIGYVPLWEKFETQAMTKHRLSFVSARQVLGHGLTILGGANIIIVDEVHYQPVDHELAIARIRHWVKSDDLPNARIVLMSSYMTPTSSSPPLFPDLSHVQLSSSQRAADMGNCKFGDATDEDTTEDLFVSFVRETLDRRIKAGNGPVLVFMPESNCISKLLEGLKDKKIARQCKKSGPDPRVKDKWQVRLFTNLGDTFSADDLGEIHLDGKSIVISPPFFDKCRSKIGDAAAFEHVLCPHWMISDRFDKVLGRDVPCSALLSKSEMRFLASHAGHAWLTCTRDTWDGASDRDSAEAERVAPTEYLMKAAVAFPGLAPYRASPNPMPLRVFPAVPRTFWSLIQLRYSALMQIIDLDENGVVLTPSGNAAVGYMLNMGLRLRGAVFLQYVTTLEDDIPDDTRCMSLRLMHLAIPLAVSMGHGYSVLHYKWNAGSEEERLGSLNGTVEKVCADTGMPNLSGLRRYGDDFLHAWLLAGSLASGKQSSGSPNWVLTKPRRLPDIVAHIRRSIPATAAHTSQGYSALARTIAGDMDESPESPETLRLISSFHECIYGAGIMNVACVKGRATSHGRAIGHATNINGLAPVLMSEGSVLDMEGLDDPLYVTFDRIKTVPLDPVTGATRMISGLSPISLRVMSDTHIYFSSIGSWDPEKDSLVPLLEYPFTVLEM